jgi:hypothetical protein
MELILKVKIELVPVHFRDAHGREVEVKFHSFATSALHGHESLDPNPGRFIPREIKFGVY